MGRLLGVERAQKLQEQAGKAGARLNSQEARRRADDLQTRLQGRLSELDREAQLSALPPVVLGGLVIVPAGLIAKMTGTALAQFPDKAREHLMHQFRQQLDDSAAADDITRRVQAALSAETP